MTVPLFLVDAFASGPFTGNPAAVCLLDEPRDPAWMQRVAMEMNQAETAFVSSAAEGFELRWFTPSVEVDLCGHATLATAHVLWEAGRLAPGQTARFQTRSGLLTAERDGDWIRLDFPATPAEPAPADPRLLAALGDPPVRFLGRTRFDHVLELDSEAALCALAPDMARLAEAGLRGVIATAASEDPDFDFLSRFFAPAVGVPEDPVTGSAHCALAPYWAARLGKKELSAWQASRRGGRLKLRLAGDRVLICGQAVTVLRATLLA